MSQGSPTHTMVCVLPLSDTDIIYCISFVNTERMCYLFGPFVCLSSPKAKLSFLFPDLDVPHQQEAMCLCLTWGGAFPHHSWEKGEPSQLSRSSSHSSAPGELVGAITRGAAGKRSWAAQSDPTGMDTPREGQQDNSNPGVEERQESGLCSAMCCLVIGWA